GDPRPGRGPGGRWRLPRRRPRAVPGHPAAPERARAVAVPARPHQPRALATRPRRPHAARAAHHPGRRLRPGLVQRGGLHGRRLAALPGPRRRRECQQARRPTPGGGERMRLSPLRVVLGLLVLALIVGTVLLAGPGSTDLPELSARSNAPNGARVLRLWLEALGYQVEEIDEEPYGVPDGTAALLVLQPSTDFDPAALDQLQAWVEDGGQLVLVAAGRGSRRLLERFGLSLEFTGERRGDAAVVQPLLLQPPVERVRLEAWDALSGDGRPAPWVAADGRVYVGSFPFGRGH